MNKYFAHRFFFVRSVGDTMILFIKIGALIFAIIKMKFMSARREA